MDVESYRNIFKNKIIDMVSMQDATLSSQVNLYISARKLKNLDTFSKSDPVCRVYEKKGNNFVRVG